MIQVVLTHDVTHLEGKGLLTLYELLDIEDKLEVKSTLLISSSRVTKDFEDIAEKGWEIGLLGDYRSYISPPKLLEQKIRLECVVGVPVTSIRMEKSHCNRTETWLAQAEAGFRVDLTLSSNGPKPIWIHRKIDRERKVLVIPTVITGDRFKSKTSSPYYECIEILKANTCAAINFNSHIFHGGSKLVSDLYSDLVKWVKTNKGECLRACDVYKLYL